MAQFTNHGRMELLINADLQDPYYYKLVSSSFVTGLSSIHTHKRSIWFTGSSRRRLYAPTSSLNRKKKSERLRVKASVTLSDEGIHDEDEYGDEDYEFEMDELASFRGLILDISYRPINVVCWRRAICLAFLEKADVLEYYDQTVNSPSGSYSIPAVLRVPHLLQVVKRRRIQSSLSRKNIIHRDNYTCQYCSSRENLTVDHVFPIARGGEWKWDNLVTACSRCNSKKGNRTPEEANMKLTRSPKVPKDYDILAIPLTNAAIKILRARKGTPEEWRQYLPIPSSDLEP